MRKIHSIFLTSLAFFFKSFFLLAAISATHYEQRTKLKGSFNEDEQVFKVSVPRTDIKVRIDNYNAHSFMGLTSWVSFCQSNTDEFMLMGDFVLLQDEVNPVMSLFLSHDVQVTALHNHFFYDEPKIYFMHIAGMGQLEKLSQAVHEVLNEIPKIRQNSLTKTSIFGSDQVAEKSEIDATKMDTLLGVRGEMQEGRYKVVVGKKTAMRDSGFTIGKEMGVNSWATFSGNEEKAIVNGDLALYENELQDALKQLRKMNINVVAIHNHMTNEDPRVLFIHYWGVGTLDHLAHYIKKAMIEKECH